ncbi:MAG: MFS transporter [Comamonadaceae bacterium]|nr:MAG: MFS transporter [Comamonadaceae bacterium]
MGPVTTGGASATPVPVSHNTAADQALYRKVSWRIVPLLLVCYIVAYLDRINIGYAQLQMKQTLTFGDAVYGLGAGIFFLGYFLFEVPSNMMLEKVGARKTLLRIMFCWGIVAAGMMFVTTPTQFYVLRFLLGVFEAGFFPGLILYLTYWYPSALRGQLIATLMCATTLAGVVAGPLSGGIMKYFDGANGWHGWQWLFLVQGLPASVLGIVAYFYLQDTPSQAHWLTAGEKARLQHNLSSETGLVQGASHTGMGQLLRDPKVYALSLVYFLLLGATYTMVFWLPTLIKALGVNDMLTIGLYAAIPNAIGVVGMILIGRSSDRMKERRWHFFACVALAAAGLFVTTRVQGELVPTMVMLSLAVIGIASATPLFFTIVSEYLSKASAAVGIALISSLGNLGAAVSPSITGLVTARTGSPVYSMYLVVALYVATGLLLLWVVRPRPAPGVARRAAPA